MNKEILMKFKIGGIVIYVDNQPYEIIASLNEYFWYIKHVSGTIRSFEAHESGITLASPVLQELYK